jgi:hypothetical protein
MSFGLVVTTTYTINENLTDNPADDKNDFYENQEIVVARYNENLDWVEQEPFIRHPIVVYNKTDNDNFVKSHNIKRTINLSNVGRESHSYFYHIIENYDNLADVTIFLPGSVDLDNKYNRAKSLVNSVEKTNKTTISCNHENDYVNANYDFKIDNYLSSHKNNQSANMDSSIQISNIRPYGKWFGENFKNGEKNECISFNSILAVSRNDILKKPKSYYENLIKQVDAHNNPEIGHYIERSWFSVFYPYEEGAEFVNY